MLCERRHLKMHRRPLWGIDFMGSLYTNMKIFHFKDKIDSLPDSISNILPPLHIRIKPTNRCNHNCSYCSYRLGNVQLGKDMVLKDQIPKEKMMEIIDDIIEMGVKAITFSGGGEPLYYPYIMESIKKLSQSSVKFAALTNGTNLQGELAEAFARHGAWLRISIDGWDNESYAAYRQTGNEEFTKVLNNIRKFKKLNGPCYLGVCIIVDKKNAFHVYNLMELLRDAGVSSVKIAPCITSNSGDENNAYHKPIFQHVIEQVARASNKLAKDDFEIFNSYHEQLETFKKQYIWCPYLQILPVIGADLNVYSCHDKAYNLDEGLLGSIKETSFKNFWF